MNTMPNYNPLSYRTFEAFKLIAGMEKDFLLYLNIQHRDNSLRNSLDDLRQLKFILERMIYNAEQNVNGKMNTDYVESPMSVLPVVMPEIEKAILKFRHDHVTFIEQTRQDVEKKKNKGITYLSEALDELEELDNYAKEEHLAPPPQTVKATVKEYLEKLIFELPYSYSVSLWYDGGVAIYASGNGCRSSLFCRANGTASLYATRDNDDDMERHYEQINHMSLMHLREAFQNTVKDV